MAYSALVVPPGFPSRKTVPLKPGNLRSGSPGKPLATPWLNQCAYYQGSVEVDSAWAGRRLDAQLLIGRGPFPIR